MAASRASWSWQKNILIGTIPVFPLIYGIKEAIRKNYNNLQNIYIERSSLKPSEQLKEIVNAELDKLDLDKMNLYMCLTDNAHPKTYGCFALREGAEIQLPVRVSFEDVEQARRLGANLEIDLGIPSFRKKVVVASEVGDEIVERMMLSDAAKHFIVQSQLQLAANSRIFVVPMLFQFTCLALAYPIYLLLGKVMAASLAVACALIIVYSAIFIQLKYHKTYKVQFADEITANLGEDYAQGAVDYFEASMRLNQLLRTVMGEEGEKNISENGDYKLDSLPFSERLSEAKKILMKMKKNDERKKRVEQRQKQKGEKEQNKEE
ncbi:hypothetical protein WR25_04883 [Diploscapter pachys]|uniref:Transmembrane protein 177 n=1 Tax=Diploscapter pachys TaxID=2018661 RepID=A0A2A2L1J5_9BILA|nr:hypothetical protein WR25_04883 [Diploscapter pachys]